VIGVGEPVPNAELLLAPGTPVRLHDLAPRGTPFLLLFYVVDWSTT
jgi:hypothetical protein